MRKIFITSVILIIAGFGYPQIDEEKLLGTYMWNDVITLPADKRPAIGLVLGGGGARGLAHIGVLKVLQRERVPIDLVVGTSVGALIGALYCSGLPIDTIQKMGREIGWDNLTNISNAALMKLLVTEQLLSNEKLEQYLVKYIGDKQFSQMLIPFVCIAADIRTGEKIIFREGSVVEAVRASSTVPGLFKPVEYRHRYLVDGGIVDNMPTDVAALMGMEFIIAVNVEADFTDNQTANVLQILHQSIYVQGRVITREMLKKADFTIQPQTGNVSAIDLWRSKECIDAGITETSAVMPQLKKMIMSKTYEKIIQ